MAKLWLVISSLLLLTLSEVIRAQPQMSDDNSSSSSRSLSPLKSPALRGRSRSIEAGESQSPRFSPDAWFSRSSLDFGFVASAPESLGVTAEFRPHPLWSIWGLYSWPLDLEVTVGVASKKLVEEAGFVIRSPDLDLPVKARIGPHRAVGASVFPFQGSFFISAGAERRTTDISSEVDSRLELVDSQGRSLTNTVFRAAASTHTEQNLLRLSIGNRWNIIHDKLYVSWFGGLVQPVGAASDLGVDVQVRNPLASDPGDIVASNLKIAEQQQEIILQDKLARELRRFETQTLPLLGISFGWHW